MANILYLVHRLPYPPDKGDKVRSYHIFEHLRARHRVFVGTFVDDRADEPHVDALRARCADLRAVRLNPRRARIASLAGLLNGEALTLTYYRSAALYEWVRETCRRESIDAVVVFSSSMVPYAQLAPGVPLLLDLVDVDSAKWTDYAPRHRWPLSWLYRREGRLLLAYERMAARASGRCYLSSTKEAELFVRMAPECAEVTEVMTNGVDPVFFAPDPERSSPFEAGELPIVFTGAMDYLPNVEAVTWFAQEVLPALRRRHPAASFHVVGRSPTAAVRALAGDGVCVTGTVPDVRPYLQHAAVVVAPLRLARGIQNKILEAMAMERPVVAARACAQALTAEPGRELETAECASEYLDAVGELLADPVKAGALGRAGRERVLRSYAWAAHLAALDRHLPIAGVTADGVPLPADGGRQRGSATEPKVVAA
jgi:sugar transferase (PEP-CTERM/EpsH1 system associated)